MKRLYFFLILFVVTSNIFAQQTTVADSLVRDSVPILLTDTTSYNTHARMMVYGGTYTYIFTEEDSTTAYLLFYDKKPNTVAYSSIWCRELRTMTPETVFLQSNDSVQYSNPQATNSGVIFYEEKHDSSITIKGLLINPLTVIGLDTVTVCTIQSPVKMVANSKYVFWLKDSILYRQQFSIDSNAISLDALDTLSTHATDVCVADYIDNIEYNFNGDFAYLIYENNQTYLLKKSYYSIVTIDSGLISDIHFNYNSGFFYKKDGIVKVVSNFQYYGNFKPIVLFGNDTVVPRYAVAEAGAVGSKTDGYLTRMAFVPDLFPNVFNYATDNNCYYNLCFNASNTFVFPNPNSYGSDLYAYPFPVSDTVRNLIMHRGFVFYTYNIITTWDLKIIFEVVHDSICSLYLVRSSVSDIAGNINTQEKQFFVNLFPNPANDNLTVEIANKQLKIINTEIVDLTGKRIKSINNKTQSNKYTININDLPAGLYFVKIKTNQGTVVKKFVKQ